MSKSKVEENELGKTLKEEADKAEDSINLADYDFSIPNNEGFRIRMANELYSALLDAHMNSLHALANKNIKEKEYIDKDRDMQVNRQFAANIMKVHFWARKRMEDMIKESEEAAEEAKKRMETDKLIEKRMRS